MLNLNLLGKDVDFWKLYIDYKVHGAYFRKLSPSGVRKYNNKYKNILLTQSLPSSSTSQSFPWKNSRLYSGAKRVAIL